MNVGITGHQDLDAPTRELVLQTLIDRMAPDLALRGYTSLAVGADQLFAEAVLHLGGEIIVVVPAADYADGFDPGARERYEGLLHRAALVIRMPRAHADEDAYWAAGQRIVDESDLLVAVWDGEPARGLGGTADVVDYARQQDKTVEVLWPSGARRG